MRHNLLLFMFATVVSPQALPAQDAVPAEEKFSGPQANEPLPPLPVQILFASNGDKTVDLAAIDADAPHRLIVFVHAITRPSIGFVRTLMTYAATRADDGLHSSVVFLADDRTALRQQLERARHALPTDIPISISVDGGEGPGSYGLNRNVTLTILIANAGTVQSNFALADPSVPVELPKVLRAICNVAGGTPPSLDTLKPPAMRPAPAMRGAGATSGAVGRARGNGNESSSRDTKDRDANKDQANKNTDEAK